MLGWLVRHELDRLPVSSVEADPLRHIDDVRCEGERLCDPLPRAGFGEMLERRLRHLESGVPMQPRPTFPMRSGRPMLRQPIRMPMPRQLDNTLRQRTLRCELPI